MREIGIEMAQTLEQYTDEVSAVCLTSAKDLGKFGHFLDAVDLFSEGLKTLKQSFPHFWTSEHTRLEKEFTQSMNAILSSLQRQDLDSLSLLLSQDMPFRMSDWKSIGLPIIKDKLESNSTSGSSQNLG
jgi:hypothetical protein